MEEEELGFGPGHHLETHGLGLCDHPFQSRPRTSRKRGAVGSGDVADQPADFALAGLPRENLKGVEIGNQQHV